MLIKKSNPKIVDGRQSNLLRKYIKALLKKERKDQL